MKDNFENCKFAGFWIRIVAFIIDYILWVIVTYPWVFVLGGAYFFLNFIFHFIVTVLFWYYKNATPGKMAIRAKILNAKTGGALSFGQCVGRYFAMLLVALPVGAGFIWIAFDKKKQGWHDKLAGTVVIREKSQLVKVQFPSKEKNHEPA